MLEPGFLYFAYGCNMDPDLLSSIVGLPVPPGWAARLDGWRLAFNKGGEGECGGEVVANLVADPRCCAFGVVYRLPRRALALLDTFEAAPEHYRRETVWVELLGRRARQAALTYVAQPRWLVPGGRPGPGYLEHLLRGAARHRLPSPYLDWLRDLAEGRADDCYRSTLTVV
jgi:hypothetical protein